MSFFEFPHTRTYDRDLGWLIKDAKTTDDIVKNILQWIEDTQPTIDDLHNLFEQINNGDLPEGMKEGMRLWMEENALDLVGSLVKMVFFEINDEGYFVAHIPNNWSDITFLTTGIDVFLPGYEYGHLVLRY